MKFLAFIFLLTLVVSCGTSNHPTEISYEVPYKTTVTPKMWEENQLTSFYVNLSSPEIAIHNFLSLWKKEKKKFI